MGIFSSNKISVDCICSANHVVSVIYFLMPTLYGIYLTVTPPPPNTNMLFMHSDEQSNVTILVIRITDIAYLVYLLMSLSVTIY